jgi:glycine/D-amino acid oxidase-like deaminating enzyme
MDVIVIGAGVIGALTAYRLAVEGAQVTIIDAAQPASAASGASFGWINASFYLNDHHYALRFAGMEAHKRLIADLKTTATVWQGCLCWEQRGAALDTQYESLKVLGYDVRYLNRAAFSALEPAVEAPERALYFAQEGAVDLAALCHDALQAAMSLGARLVSGVAVQAIETRADRVTGVRWSGGVVPADRVVVAAGTRTGGLLRPLGVPLPMLDRPGLILRTHPLPPILSHILVSPEQELRQDLTGRLLAPVAASHQSDDAEVISDNPLQLADRAAERVRGLVGCDVTWEAVTQAYRPVPGDGLPVMGACGAAGLYALTMHSGATLAPLVSEIAAREVLERPLSNAQAYLVEPYRPQRFATQISPIT